MSIADISVRWVSLWYGDSPHIELHWWCLDEAGIHMTGRSNRVLWHLSDLTGQRRERLMPLGMRIRQAAGAVLSEVDPNGPADIAAILRIDLIRKDGGSVGINIERWIDDPEFRSSLIIEEQEAGQGFWLNYRDAVPPAKGEAVRARIVEWLKEFDTIARAIRVTRII